MLHKHETVWHVWSDQTCTLSQYKHETVRSGQTCTLSQQINGIKFHFKFAAMDL